MHLVAGFLLAALFGKKKKEHKSPLLDLFYPVRTQHLLPGRVRFQVEKLKDNPRDEKFLLEQLPKVRGVSRVNINTITGSILLLYDEDEVQPELLCTVVIRLLGLENELDKPPISIVLKEIREMGGSLNRAVYERTGGLIDLWTAIPIILAVVGARKIMTQRYQAVPTGFTLLWWAYHALMREPR